MTRFAFVLLMGNALLGSHLLATPIQLGNDKLELAGSGTATDTGGFVATEPIALPFATTITSTGANAGDTTLVEPTGDGLKFWIGDFSGVHQNWTTTFTVDFVAPINGLRVTPISPVNTSDDITWTVSWNEAAGNATITNSFAIRGQHSIYSGGSLLQNGPFQSGTSFRLDDDNQRSGDTNGTARGDINLSIPTNPWNIALPDGLTSLTIEARLSEIADSNHAFEGIGIDTSQVSIVPEPAANMFAILAALLLATPLRGLRLSRR